jgi:hypothetical protein
MGHLLAVGHEAEKLLAIRVVEYPFGDLSDLSHPKIEGRYLLVVTHAVRPFAARTVTR